VILKLWKHRGIDLESKAFGMIIK